MASDLWETILVWLRETRTWDLITLVNRFIMCTLSERNFHTGLLISRGGFADNNSLQIRKQDEGLECEEAFRVRRGKKEQKFNNRVNKLTKMGTLAPG